MNVDAMVAKALERIYTKLDERLAECFGLPTLDGKRAAPAEILEPIEKYAYKNCGLFFEVAHERICDACLHAESVMLDGERKVWRSFLRNKDIWLDDMDAVRQSRRDAMADAGYDYSI